MEMKLCLSLWYKGTVNMFVGDRSGKDDIWTGQERSKTRIWRKIHNKKHVDSCYSQKWSSGQANREFTSREAQR
jgi:hypothetical protein